MLGGLEAVELKLSEVLEDNNSFRFDSEYFKKEYLELQKEIYKYPHKQLGDFAKVTDGEHGSVIFEKSGIKYLGAENIKKGFVDISNIKYVNKIVDERNKRASVNVNDILISIKGTLGEVAIAEHWLLPANMSRDVAIIKNHAKNEFIDDYIVMFLMSKIGNKLSERLGSGGVQKMITLERLRTIMIPKLSIDFQNKISKIYNKSRNNLSKSKTIYKQSEQLLLKELDLLDFKPSKENISIKSFSQSFGDSGRLDSEYYLPKYDEIIKKIKSYRGGYDILSNQFKIINGKTPKKYLKQGIKVIKTKNIRIPTIDIDNISDYTQESNVITQNGDLVFASMGVGSLGRVSYITNKSSNMTIDVTLKIFRNKNNKFSLVTLLFLTSQIGQELIYKYVIGSTGIISIGNDNVQNLIIPIIDDKIQTQIEEKIKKSFKLKEESKELLELAKRAVEAAIEEGEEVAMELINE